MNTYRKWNDSSIGQISCLTPFVVLCLTPFVVLFSTSCLTPFSLTVKRDKLGAAFGSASDEVMLEVGRCLAVFLGIAR